MKDRIAANLILSISTCHVEKVAAQMDGGRRLWTALHITTILANNLFQTPSVMLKLCNPFPRPVLPGIGGIV